MNQPTEQPETSVDSNSLLACERVKQLAHFQAGFLGTASHELRAPINKIISLHQLILEDLCESPEEEKEFLQQANQAIYQVLKNLDLLIQVSKLNIGAINPELQTVSLPSVLQNVYDLMAMKCLNRNCRLTTRDIAPDLTVVTDSQWLRQMLMLLIDGVVVAGGAMIQLSAENAADSRTVLTLTSDIAAFHWQETAAIQPQPAAEITAMELSPGFRYQLATLMVHPLRGTIACRSREENGSAIVISLPSSLDE